MIRPFDWRDLALLRRVRDRGLCLDAQLAFTRGPHILGNALREALAPGRSACTLVARPEGDGIAALGQFVQRGEEPHAKLAFLGPVEALEQDIGGQLLDALAHVAGERGAHNLIADVDESSPAFEGLRRAGFAIYARQRVWRLADQREALTPPDAVWRMEAPHDGHAIRSLYLNLVPGLVQQVEPSPSRTAGGLVYWREGELLGYLDVERGPRGIWVHPYFHPAVEHIERLLAGLLALLHPEDRRPLFVCVRSYQSWLNDPLARLGFEPWVDQAVMVKRLTAAVRRPALAALPAIEGTRPEPTAPFSPMERGEIANFRRQCMG